MLEVVITLREVRFRVYNQKVESMFTPHRHMFLKVHKKGVLAQIRQKSEDLTKAMSSVIKKAIQNDINWLKEKEQLQFTRKGAQKPFLLTDNDEVAQEMKKITPSLLSLAAPEASSTASGAASDVPMPEEISTEIEKIAQEAAEAAKLTAAEEHASEQVDAEKPAAESATKKKLLTFTRKKQTTKKVFFASQVKSVTLAEVPISESHSSSSAQSDTLICGSLSNLTAAGSVSLYLSSPLSTGVVDQCQESTSAELALDKSVVDQSEACVQEITVQEENIVPPEPPMTKDVA